MDGAANPEIPMIYQSPVSQACGEETMVGVSDQVKQAQARTPPQP